MIEKMHTASSMLFVGGLLAHDLMQEKLAGKQRSSRYSRATNNRLPEETPDECT